MAGDIVQPGFEIDKGADALERSLIEELHELIRQNPGGADGILRELGGFWPLLDEAAQPTPVLSQESVFRRRFVSGLAALWNSQADIRVHYDKATERAIRQSETPRNRYTRIQTYAGRTATWQAAHNENGQLEKRGA